MMGFTLGVASALCWAGLDVVRKALAGKASPTARTGPDRNDDADGHAHRRHVGACRQTPGPLGCADHGDDRRRLGGMPAGTALA